MSSNADPHQALLLTVRVLYDAVDAFDAALASEMRLDRTALRAVNAMEGGAVSPGDLGRRLHLASGSVTALLDRLERAGHIERRLSDADRRRRDANLTPGTRRRARERYEALGHALSAAFDGTDAHKLTRAIAALESVAGAFLASARLVAGAADAKAAS